MCNFEGSVGGAAKEGEGVATKLSEEHCKQ
jgi:hypothetical protein